MATSPLTLCDFLRDPTSYPEATTAVEVIETHISWVFLTQKYVYKLKKPVRFDFLDFSTAELRHAACESEVRLNRRLAPNVYLGVIPVTRSLDGYAFDGSGPPVDWLVKMRRLAGDRALDVLIRSDSVTPDELDQIAATLTAFYRRLPPVAIRTDAYLREWEDHVQGNRRELLIPGHGCDPAQIRRIHAKQMRMLRLFPNVLRSRVLDGRIVEGHGDLRPEHIYLNGQPNIIDCIEFSSAYRTLDVVDELSFLAVECSRLGAKHIGGQILDYYCRASDDIPPTPLLAFYMCYRACVRAKVLALRASQVEEAEEQLSLRHEVRRYLDLADEYAAELGPPILIMVRGLMGTGKSTLALTLQQSLDLELLQTDAIRHEMYGPSDQAADYGEGHYSAENRQAVYEVLFGKANRLLAEQQSVILDGTFLSRSLRAQAASLARRHSAIFLIVHCRCPDDVAIARIKARQLRGGSESEARPELLPEQRRDEQSDPPGVAACEILTTTGPMEMSLGVFKRLGELIQGI